MYDQAAIDCFRYLGFKSLEQVDMITIREYRLLMKAARLREVDMSYKQHAQAFLNLIVKSQKKAGKNKAVYKYKTFRQFFDYEAEIRRAEEDSKDKPEKGSILGRVLNGLGKR